MGNLIGAGTMIQKGNNPHIVIDTVDYPQSKDDKNKNNTIIARRGSSLTENQQKEKSPSIKRFDEDTDDEYVQYMNSVDRYRQNNPNPKPFRPVTARTDAIANPLRKMSDGQGQTPGSGLAAAPVRQQSFSFTPQAKSKQTTPVRDNSEVGARISRSVPKEVIRKSKETQQTLKEETQAEILGLVKTNKETGQVEKTNDMDYEDYMNIINKVRKTKEHTRVRTEQARLSSMYAQELKRQEEIKLEGQRFEEEKTNANKMPIITTVSSLFSQSMPKP